MVLQAEEKGVKSCSEENQETCQEESDNKKISQWQRWMACVLGLSFSQWSIISFFEIWNYTSWNGSLPTTWLVPRCGSPKTLKLSQVYPRGYGKAIMKHHTSWNVPWDLVWRMVAPLSCDVIIGSLYTNVYFQPYHGPRQSLPMSWTSRRAFLKLTLRWLFPRWDGMEDVAGRKIKNHILGSLWFGSSHLLLLAEVSTRIAWHGLPWKE